MRENILNILKDSADEKFKAFNDRIVNNETGHPSLGVRIPALRTLAKDIGKGAYGAPERYFREIDALSKEAFAGLFQEEHMLYGMLIGTAKLSDAARKSYMDNWIPRVLSWADCDCGTGTWKFIKKDLRGWLPYVEKWLSAEAEFALRVPLVVLLEYYISEDYIDRVLELYGKNYSDAYYVKMAQAWGLSVCYVKFPEKTLAFFKDNALDAWTHNKAIQKCRESLRVSKEEKELLNRLKR